MVSPAGAPVALHQALTLPVLLAGIPRDFAILEGTMAAAIIFGLHLPWIGVPLALALHAVAYAVTRHDPWLFPLLRRHLGQHAAWTA
jgi:type IV secretion system protein VirB3